MQRVNLLLVICLTVFTCNCQYQAAQPRTNGYTVAHPTSYQQPTAAPMLATATQSYGSSYQTAPLTQPILSLQAVQQQLVQCPVFDFQHNVILLSPSEATSGTMNEWKIQFQALTTLDVGLVDIHWKIIHSSGLSNVEVNERMTKLSGQLFERNSLTNVLFPLKLNVGDCVEYWFTYCLFINNVRIDCDTGKSRKCIMEQQPQIQPISQPSYQQTPLLMLPTSPQFTGYKSQIVPVQQFQCPIFDIQHNVISLFGGDALIGSEFKIQFQAMTSLDIGNVDVHWKIIRSGVADIDMNERMTKMSGQLFERNSLTNVLVPLKLGAGDCLEYWFTYYVLGDNNVRVDCDTGKFRKCIDKPLSIVQVAYQQPYQQPPQQHITPVASIAPKVQQHY